MGLLRNKKDKDKAQDSQQAAAPSLVDEYKGTDSYSNADSYNDVDPYIMADTTSAMSFESRSTGGPPPRNDRGTQSAGPWFTSRQIRLFKKPPPAELAAYSGPPRYDWVDIVGGCPCIYPS
jgi:hypothetical protein